MEQRTYLFCGNALWPRLKRFAQVAQVYMRELCKEDVEDPSSKMSRLQGECRSCYLQILLV